MFCPLSGENPTYLRYGDSPDPDSDPENTVNPRDQTDSRTAHQTDWAGDQADSRTGHQAEWDGDQAVPYSLHRTRIGSPSINRRSFTDEEIKRFMRKSSFLI